MKSEKLNLRINKDLKDKLRQLAIKDHRSLSNYVIMQLEKIAGSQKNKK